MLRRDWLLLLTGMLCWPVRAAVAQTQQDLNSRFSNQELADLRELLTNGLKVRTAGERAFIDQVVKTVERRQLPESLVKAIFQRARFEHSRYPLPYFAAMLREVAKQRNVKL